MQELVCRINGALTEPWNKKTGRPKSCELYRAVEIACMYIRQNAVQEFLGDLRNISQSTVSRIVTTLVPMVKAVLTEFVPSVEEAIELVNGRVCLVDGAITPLLVLRRPRRVVEPQTRHYWLHHATDLLA